MPSDHEVLTGFPAAFRLSYMLRRAAGFELRPPMIDPDTGHLPQSRDSFLDDLRCAPRQRTQPHRLHFHAFNAGQTINKSRDPTTVTVEQGRFREIVRPKNVKVV